MSRAVESDLIYYIENDNEITRYFKETIREAEVLRKHPSFELQYVAAAPFHRIMHPYRWVRPGMKAVQVGAAEWMLDFGVSMCLILSALVGREGEVLVVEPDQTNIDSLSAYLERHRIANVRIHKMAAWKTKDVLSFTFYGDRTSSNVLTEVRDRSGWKDDERHRGRPVTVRNIEVNSLDDICEELGFRPDFVNITINDCEYEAIQGMRRLCAGGAMVSWLCGGAREWWRQCFDDLASWGYDSVVGNAPYTHRGVARADGSPSFFSVQDAPQEFFAVAMPADDIPPDPLLRRVALDKIPGSHDFMWRDA